MVSLTEFTKKTDKVKDDDDFLENIEEDLEEEGEVSPLEKRASMMEKERRGTKSTVNTNYKLKNNILKNIDIMSEEIESVYDLISE